MPTTPKLGNRSRLIGRVEVYIKAESQQQSDTDRHIRITREVTINLYRHPINSPHPYKATERQKYDPRNSY